jgi:hypothetical protein
MDNYIQNYDKYEKVVIYDFKLGYGGIGDCIKFFIHLLELCIKYEYKLYYLVNNIKIERYLKLKYDKMYINNDNLKNTIRVSNDNQLKNISTDKNYIVEPFIFYHIFNPNYTYNFSIKIEDVFDFSDDVKENVKNLLPENITEYISIHLRLGDKYLETEREFIHCKEDSRSFSETKLFQYIEENYNKNLIFFCDNDNYKHKIKNIYSNIILTNCCIGHTSLSNTTDKQILDSITDFYILTNSQMICSVSNSGFSVIASKFKNIPIFKIY